MAIKSISTWLTFQVRFSLIFPTEFGRILLAGGEEGRGLGGYPPAVASQDVWILASPPGNAETSAGTSRTHGCQPGPAH